MKKLKPHCWKSSSGVWSTGTPSGWIAHGSNPSIALKEALRKERLAEEARYIEERNRFRERARQIQGRIAVPSPFH